jgi:WD40 repeat protein
MNYCGPSKGTVAQSIVLHSWKMGVTLQVVVSNRFSCLPTADGNLGDDGHVIIWALENGSLRRRLKPKQGPIVAIKWLRGDSREICYLMSAGANGTLVIWHFNIASISQTL